MCFRTCVWTLLGTAHLIVVIVGASDGLSEPSPSAPMHLLRWYGRLSGADSRYGFYAPDVGSEYRARFVLQDNRGSTWRDDFEQGPSPEARLRLQGIIHWVFDDAVAQESPELRQRLMRSWAATMFTRHPNAVSLRILIEDYDVPTLAEYRAGRRPVWRILYEAQLQRDRVPEQGRIEP
jgi:hypothetical protein